MAEGEPAGVAVADEHGSDPVRWWVIDAAVETVDLSAVPPPASPVWEARYDNDCERGKRTTRLPGVVPGVDATIAWMRAQAADWSARLGYPVEDDPTMHGAGLHVTGPGGWLSTHLDYCRHPVVPNRRRALNLIAFLNPEWWEEWGGAFVLTDPVGAVVRRFYPHPGRMIAFETNDLSYHAVEPVTGPVERVTAAVYYLSEAGPHNTRQRALFLPARGKM